MPPNAHDDEDPGWSPDGEREDVNLDRDFKKKFMKFADQLTHSMEREVRSVIPPQGSPAGVPYVFGRFSLEIRPISNGFIVRYIDMKKVMAPNGQAVDVPSSVEAFIDSAAGAVTHLEKAMAVMRKAFDTAPDNYGPGPVYVGGIPDPPERF